MTKTLYIFIIILVIVAAVFSVLRVTSSITMDQYQDYLVKSLLVLGILLITSVIVQAITSRK